MRGGLAVLVFGLAAAVSWAQAPFDPVTSDPPTTDAEFPTRGAGFTIQSGGKPLYGRSLLAQGKGPHPTVLLLHGNPGIELNMDLAQAIRRAGWNVFMFHYRGSWGSGGSYEFSNVLEDTATVVAYLRTKAGDPAWRVDPGRVVLVGHSVGGFAALNVAAGDAQLRSVASISGFDVAFVGERAQADPQVRENLKNFIKNAAALNVPDLDAFMQKWMASPLEWKFPALAPRLASKNVLLIAGAKDTVAAPERHHAPLLQAIKAQEGSRVTEVTLDTDHAYSDRRIALTRAVLAWLQRQ